MFKKIAYSFVWFFALQSFLYASSHDEYVLYQDVLKALDVYDQYAYVAVFDLFVQKKIVNNVAHAIIDALVLAIQKDDSHTQAKINWCNQLKNDQRFLDHINDIYNARIRYAMIFLDQKKIFLRYELDTIVHYATVKKMVETIYFFVTRDEVRMTVERLIGEK